MSSSLAASSSAVCARGQHHVLGCQADAAQDAHGVGVRPGDDVHALGLGLELHHADDGHLADLEPRASEAGRIR